VYIAARSQEKSQKAIDELKNETGNESVFFLKLDLTDLVTIKTAAEEFIGKEAELHALYNNAYMFHTHAFCREKNPRSNIT
jgi:NAD(P)-dependent dehydrogenase (short-subunit alcohol dehydrogenase family)